MFPVVGIEKGWWRCKGWGDEISLKEEELAQLSIKSLKVVLNNALTLICSIWTKKAYNPNSFRAQMKSI